MPEAGTDSKNVAERPPWLGRAQIGLILAALAIALYFARAPDPVVLEGVAAAGPAERVVKAFQPVAADRSQSIMLTGGIGLATVSVIESEVVGRVAWVSPDFRAGGEIPAGEPIVRIDDAEARISVEAARAGVRAALGDAQRAQARAELKLAELQLERTTLTLPFDARILAAKVAVGKLVGPAGEVGGASRMGSAYHPDALQASAPISAADLARLAPVAGRAATVHVDGQMLAGEVERSSWSVSADTRMATVWVRLLLVEGDGGPPPGSFAEISIAGPVHADAYALPESAFQDEGVVWVVRDGALEAHSPQRLGREHDRWIVAAFDTGEGVVLGPVPGARAGLAVSAVALDSSGGGA